ncbi:MAG: response regulator transcription factor [Anaerolineales bacterium]|nr:response regulator transcription factor [Anaerolineales bacterium]
MRALVVEDEAALRDRLAEALRANGFAVDVAGDGEEAVFAGQEYPIDVVILDLALPRLSGLEVLAAWRAAGRDFPVLILTVRDSWRDKVAGLEAGADDYLTKPFHTEEVLARLRALLRRAAGRSHPLIEAGGLAIDTASQTVAVDGHPVPLTGYEYRLLEYLALHAGEVVSKTDLSGHIYDEDTDRDSNVVEVLVARLRRKLDPRRVREPIETLRGRGYRLRPPGENA